MKIIVIIAVLQVLEQETSTYAHFAALNQPALVRDLAKLKALTTKGRGFSNC